MHNIILEKINKLEGNQYDMILDFRKEYILENERAQLIPLSMDHFEILAQYSVNEPDLWQYSLMPAHTKENMHQYVHAALLARDRNDSYPFIVLDKRTRKIAGSTRFYDYKSYHKTTQLGFTWYGREFWGTGLNKNCKYLLLEWAFDKLELERVEFRADLNNKRSIAAMKSIGCVQEGVLRQNCIGLKGRRDSIVLSILKTEWDDKLRRELGVKCKLS